MTTLEQNNSSQIPCNNDTHDADALIPPKLPSFLASTFDLRPIIGTPTNEQVKLIHGALRALNSMLHGELYAQLPQTII